MNEETISGTLTVTGTINGTITIGGGSAPVLQEKTVTPRRSEQVVTPDTGYDALSQVTVNATPLQLGVIAYPNEDGFTVEPEQGYVGLRRVSVAPCPLQSKTVTPDNTIQHILPDSGYYGLESVDVGAVSSGYDFVMRGPDNSVTLPGYMFYQDTNIKTFTGRSGDMAMTSISEHCFEGCSNLEAVYLPACGSFNDYDYFDNCPKLKDVYMAIADAGSVPRIDHQSEFSGIDRIHVPADQLSQFQASSYFSQLLSKLVGDYVV